ncbi:MAG: manganese efflux pump MntP family protein [Candidatus Eremiobacteraeota bacterium]|nr:manganese efflux pump MntP family protein [Candidatus Eremiobacteraeota bacterium]
MRSRLISHTFIHAGIMLSVKILAFVPPLGLDTLAVAIVLGINKAALLRVAVTFMIFETLAPVAGLLLGGIVPLRYREIASLLGGLLLFLVGVHVLGESKKLGDEAAALSFATLRFAVLAGVSISLDELAIGFPLRIANLPVIPTLVGIGIQAFLVSCVGIFFGRKLGERIAIACGAIAGLAFMGLGLYLASPAALQLRHG